MSLELQEARELLNLLEEVSVRPELILTDLFLDDISCDYIFHQIDVGKNSAFEYLQLSLKKLPIFYDCFVKIRGCEVFVYIPSLKFGRQQSFQPEDKILKINAESKTYRLCDSTIYSEVLLKKYTLKTNELSDFWKKYENFTFGKRIKTAFLSLTSDKRILTRIGDFFFTLFVSKKKINAALDREKEKIKKKNNSELKYYNERIALQNFYKENSQKQIERIVKKQKEITGYLETLGYRENPEMNEY